MTMNLAKPYGPHGLQGVSPLDHQPQQEEERPSATGEALPQTDPLTPENLQTSSFHPRLPAEGEGLREPYPVEHYQ